MLEERLGTDMMSNDVLAGGLLTIAGRACLSTEDCNVLRQASARLRGSSPEAAGGFRKHDSASVGAHSIEERVAVLESLALVLAPTAWSIAWSARRE